jgi:ABC-2 type transport system permease protein
MPPVTEIYPTHTNVSVKPSLIQNNVPGFILFAMFFIVIPLSGSMITEKNEGSFSRLRTLPVRIFLLLSSKVLLFLLVSMIQFILMLSVGIWLLPSLLGIPSLQIGSHILTLLMATIAAALAAIGFGLMVGTLASSPGQGALFGSVMVVILGVISGTFLPVYLMPTLIRVISSASPIRWGIDNYLEIFVRNGTLVRILPNIFLLLAFFIFAMIISIANFARQK